MKKALTALLMAFMLVVPAGAQVRPDSVLRAPRTAPADVMEQARAEAAFRYREEARAPEGESLWSRVLRALDTLFNAATHPNARPFHYALLVAFVLWLVVRVARMEPGGAFRRAPARVDVGGAMPDRLGRRDYLAEARQARAGGDLRLSVRFLFLHVLQRLADAGRITYRPEKTNRAYLAEAGPQLRPLLAPFALAFEQAWYGGLTPGPSDVDRLEATLAEFDAHLRPGHAG